MIPFIFDTTVIISGMFLTLFSIFIFTIHKKFAFYCLFFSLAMSIVAIWSSYKKNTSEVNSTNKSIILQDSLTKLKDSLQSTKAFLISAETTNANANQRLALAEKYFEAGNKPHIDISIHNLVLKKGEPISLILELENIGKSPAYHFFNLIGLFVDSVTDIDSIYMVTNAKQHKRENVTLVHEFFLVKTLSHSLSEAEFDSLSQNTLFLLGTISYYDDLDKYHLFFFCYKLPKDQRDRYENYAKYNSGH